MRIVVCSIWLSLIIIIIVDFTGNGGCSAHVPGHVCTAIWHIHHLFIRSFVLLFFFCVLICVAHFKLIKCFVCPLLPCPLRGYFALVGLSALPVHLPACLPTCLSVCQKSAVQGLSFMKKARHSLCDKHTTSLASRPPYSTGLSVYILFQQCPATPKSDSGYTSLIYDGTMLWMTTLKDLYSMSGNESLRGLLTSNNKISSKER